MSSRRKWRVWNISGGDTQEDAVDVYTTDEYSYCVAEQYVRYLNNERHVYYDGDVIRVGMATPSGETCVVDVAVEMLYRYTGREVSEE